MHSPFPFDTMLVFAFLSVALLAGLILRAQVPFFQRFLFPGCLIGGVLGLLLVQTGIVPWPVSGFESCAYHCFNISFISVGLIPGEKKAGEDNKVSRQMWRGTTWMALMQGLTFPMQAALGGLLVIFMGMAGVELFPTFGFLVPLGFNEGPGQALSIGKVWEGAGFAHAATIGLTFAAAGYFCAFFIGVPLVNRGIRKGYANSRPRELTPDFLKGIRSPEQPPSPAGKLTLYSGNAETLAFQAALVGLVYGLTYIFVSWLCSLFSADVASMLWGFFFFFGLCLALLVKQVLAWFRVDRLIDPGLQRRITGWAVDYLLVATVTAIQLKIVWDYLLPIGLLAVVNAAATTFVVLWFGKRLDAYNLERTAAIYGTVTGTVSCGLLLLRIVDPDFKSPVAMEIALMNVIVLPIVGGGSVLVNGPIWWGWSVGLTVSVFVAILSICLGLLWWLKLCRP